MRPAAGSRYFRARMIRRASRSAALLVASVKCTSANICSNSALVRLASSLHAPQLACSKTRRLERAAPVF